MFTLRVLTVSAVLFGATPALATDNETWTKNNLSQIIKQTRAGTSHLESELDEMQKAVDSLDCPNDDCSKAAYGLSNVLCYVAARNSLDIPECQM